MGAEIIKTAIALQELEEMACWLELLADLQRETDELTAILVTSVKTLKSRKAR